MNPLQTMMQKYSCENAQEVENALKEVLQEITLLALWRSKFFEKASFYGGTALRILYGLDRFSEDMDFSLLKPDKNFDLKAFELSIERELKSLGVEVTFRVKKKAQISSVQSAFLKTSTVTHLMELRVSPALLRNFHKESTLKIKIEVDTDPPGEPDTEFKELYQPYPFPVRTFTLPCLFAGKMHALLFRSWKTRVKGRDWYDFIWYVSNNVPLDLTHFISRMQQTEEQRTLTEQDFNRLLQEKIEGLNIAAAKQDVLPFINDPAKLELWSQEFFLRLQKKMFFT